jgi:formate dehydrogenase subunit delta
MQPDHLIRMVNQIGNFFEAMPDRAEATKDLAQHIKRFWDPRMRSALLGHVDQSGDAELGPLVKLAIVRHRDLIQ